MWLFFLKIAFADTDENNIEGKYVDHSGQARDYALNYSEFSPARNFNYGENKFALGTETGLEIPLNQGTQIEVYSETSSLGLLENFSHVDLKFEKEASDESRWSIKPAIYGRRFPMSIGLGAGVALAIDKELQRQQLVAIELNTMGNFSWNEQDESEEYMLGNVLLRGTYQKLSKDNERMFGTSLAFRGSTIDDGTEQLEAAVLLGLEYLKLRPSSGRLSCRIEAGPKLTQTTDGLGADFEIIPTVQWYRIISN